MTQASRKPRSSLKNCLILSMRGGSAPLIHFEGTHIHIEGATIMPKGQERLWPTVQRSARVTYLRKTWPARRHLLFPAQVFRLAAQRSTTL